MIRILYRKKYDNSNIYSENFYRKTKFIFYYLLFYSLFFYVFFKLYIIPYGIFPVTKIFFPLFFVLTFLFIFLSKRINIKDLIFIFCLVAFTIISFSYYAIVNSLVLFIVYFIGKKYFSIDKKIEIFLLFLCIFFFFYYLKMSETGSSIGRYISNIPDPNFTGLLILILFYFLQKNKLYILSIPFVTLGIYLTLSRNLFLSVLIFWIVLFAKKTKLFKSFVKKINLPKLFLIVFVFDIAISFAYFYLPIKGQLLNSNSRLGTIKDSSNEQRFLVNNFLIDEILMNKKFIISGEKNYEEYFKNNVGNIVHNSFLDIVAKTGLLYSLFYFFVLIKIFRNYYNIYNYEYFFSYLFFASFLMDCFESYFLISFFYVLNSKELKYSFYAKASKLQKKFPRIPNKML